MSHRPLSTIAREIQEDYASKGKPVYFAAKPYVDAMRSMTNVTDSFGYEDGRSVVLYALHNLSYWRGPKAKEVKAELKAILASK